MSLQIGMIVKGGAVSLDPCHWNQKEVGLGFDSLEPGDSFLVYLSPEAEKRRVEYGRVKCMRHYYQCWRSGRKYQLRSEGNDVRVYRKR